ncbi:MAG TPA: hypothetical protein VIL00_08950 [Pseudonocardiaceae bacterium]
MSGSRLEALQAAEGVAPEFLVSPEMLDAVSPTGLRGGMVLGTLLDRQEAQAVSVLRNAPTRIVLVGGMYLARLVTLRAMATGAWVVIATGRPNLWQPIVRAAGTGPDGRPSPVVQIRRLAPVELPLASEDSPLLVVHDGGPTPQEILPPRSPWQTTLYVLPYLHPQAGTIINQADLVMLQRLPMGQAELAARMWRLHPQMLRQLASLKDDQVVLTRWQMWLPLRLFTTQKEQQLLGPIRRGD